MEVGLDMVEELFQEKIHLKSTDLLPMLLDGLLKVWLQTNFARDVLFKYLTLLELQNL